MSEIGLDAARSIIAAAFAGASAQGVENVTAVVTDTGGAVRALERNDSSGPFGSDIAIAKARTALGMRRSTLLIAEAFGERWAAVAGISAAVGGTFMPFGGGVVIVDAHDTILGAAAFGGGPHQIDHAIIVDAVKAAGLFVLR